MYPASSSTPKTLQIFLPAGDPRGLRVAEITTGIAQLFEVPRSLLGSFFEMPESGQVGLYFLFGGAEEKPQVYIGQTEDLRGRLATHHKAKDFWERALVLVSSKQSLTQTHTRFLEWQAIAVAQRVNRYALENGNGGSKPHTPAPLEADCQAFFEMGRILLSTLGYPIFEPLTGRLRNPGDEEGADGAASEGEVFYCRSSGADGRGLYTAEGFVVLKGSSGRSAAVPSFQGTACFRLRQRLVEAGELREEGGRLVFTQDRLFASPSTAAQMLLGRTSNGWVEWKTGDGRTLSEAKR